MSQHKLKAIETHVLAAQKQAEHDAAYAAHREAAMKQLIANVAPRPLIETARFDDEHGLTEEMLKMLDEGSPAHGA